MHNYLKNKYLSKAISMLVILAFCFLHANCYAREFPNLKSSKMDTLSPAISILNNDFTNTFLINTLSAKGIDEEALKIIINKLFPELDFSKGFHKHRLQHTVSVVLFLNKLINEDYTYFKEKLKTERSDKLPKEEKAKEEILETYENNLKKLHDFYGELEPYQQNELILATVLHDLGFTFTDVDYDHPKIGSEKSRAL